MNNSNRNWFLRMVFVAMCLQFSILNSQFSLCSAQPKKSRVQKTEQQQKQQAPTKQTGMTDRMRLMYPTALDMPEDVVWRRDIYREIDLNEESNSGLYYPVEPMGKHTCSSWRSMATYLSMSIVLMAMNCLMPQPRST